jgi:hypothetical protein
LVPVGIKDHESKVMSTFAVENRLLPRGPSELKSHLNTHSGIPFSQSLKDFHLMLYIAEKSGFSPEEVDSIAAAVWVGDPIPDGYALVLRGLGSV